MDRLNRSNPSALFSGGEEPSIQELSQPSSSRDQESDVADMFASLSGASQEAGGISSRLRTRFTNPSQGSFAATDIMRNMLQQQHSSSGGASDRRAPTTSTRGRGRGTAGISRSDVSYEGAEGLTEETSAKLLAEVHTMVRRYADSTDGIFAELRALSGNVTLLRQELAILKESSARFPSDPTRSMVSKLPKYDP